MFINNINRLNEAARWMSLARKTVALTGAGVSTESGIPDFRSENGLWTRFPPGEYATLGAFHRHPQKVWQMLTELEGLLDAQPNAGHLALAALEREGALAGIVTQNIDGLHQAAGSRTVVEFHGNGHTFTCLRCNERFSRQRVTLMPRKGAIPHPPDCAQGQCLLKPDVVFFDEQIPGDAIVGTERLLAGADLVIVAGTSCEVYPAAEIPFQVRRQGGKVIEINLEPAMDLQPDLLLQGAFGQVMPRLLEAWRSTRNDVQVS